MKGTTMKVKACFLTSLFILICSSVSFADSLLVFAGSGMRVPLAELGDAFTEKSGITVNFDFDGSGRLGTKIMMGVKPDLFIPGSDAWALKLKDRGYVKECLPVAYHTPVIITPRGNDKVKDLEDLTSNKVKLALGDAKAAAIGRNNKKMFEKMGITLADMNIVARGINVKQLVQWVESGTVDASIVWRADAVQSGRVRVIEIPAGVNQIDSIPLCLMSRPSHPQAAEQFRQYLLKNGPAVFARHGFEPIEVKP